MGLSKFLVRAKRATYASEQSLERTLPDGCKVLTCQEGKYRYQDKYYGFNPFSGQETVWEDGKIIWSMNYFGKITSDAMPAKEVYSFLKNALRLVTRESPFRGPRLLTKGNLKYTNKTDGGIPRFTGVERILYKGNEIYRLDYHGGAM